MRNLCLPGFSYKVLNNRPPEQAGQPRPNKEIPMHAPTAMPGIKSEELKTKNTNSKLENKLDQLASLKKIELVRNLRTILPTTSLPTADSKGPAVSDATVHTTQRSPGELETVAKTKGNIKS